jgi:hypothetical protein
MSKDGRIYICGNTVKALGGNERFELFYDRLTNSIGVKPSNSLSPNSQKTCDHGKRGGRRIHAYRVLQQFQIPTEGSVRFIRPTIDDEGILVLDLRQTTPLVRKRR